MVPLFADYAALVFRAFGNRVMHWTTMNEPQTFCFSGYSTGGHAPGVKSLVCRGNPLYGPAWYSHQWHARGSAHPLVSVLAVESQVQNLVQGTSTAVCCNGIRKACS